MPRALLAVLVVGSLLTPFELAQSGCCPVLELRQYTLKPGQRDALIDLFERHFIESQEATGMTLVAQFRDRHRPDRFVWLRGFADMESRRQSLEAFYGGPVWAAHREAANATMIDATDVLLLRPARHDLTFAVPARTPSPGPPSQRHTIVLAGIYELETPADPGLVSRFEQHVVPILGARTVRLEAVYVTEPAPNTFPKLPVRSDESVLVWFGTLGPGGHPQPAIDELATAAALDGRRATILTLEPTPRSRLGNR